jgi:molybdopterin/thiamine biosynthesis adenylyltransferase
MIITPKELQNWMDKGKSFRVVDIRPGEQRALDPIVTLDATIISEEDLNFSSLDGDPVVLVCQYGLNTERLIRENCEDKIFSLLGGAQAWNEYKSSKADLSRYARQMVLPQVGVKGQKALTAAKVTIVGMGGLGCPASQYLTAAGVGTLQLIDGDVVELSNIPRQPLYRSDDIGRPKVEAAVERLSSLNSGTTLEKKNVFLSADNANDLLGSADIIVDATDSLAVRRILDEYSAANSIPLVYGGLYRFEGQVSVFNHHGGPRYADLFPEHSITGDTCADTGVLGMLPGIIGNIQALETVKIILGVEPNLSGKLLLYDGLSHETNIIDLN